MQPYFDQLEQSQCLHRPTIIVFNNNYFSYHAFTRFTFRVGVEQFDDEPAHARLRRTRQRAQWKQFQFRQVIKYKPNADCTKLAYALFWRDRERYIYLHILDSKQNKIRLEIKKTFEQLFNATQPKVILWCLQHQKYLSHEIYQTVVKQHPTFMFGAGSSNYGSDTKTAGSTPSYSTTQTKLRFVSSVEFKFTSGKCFFLLNNFWLFVCYFKSQCIFGVE